MFIPLGKISGILDEVVENMSCKRVSARKLARVTGRIISNFLIMGDVCKLMTKAMHRLIECRRGWDAQVVLDSDVLVGLTFWREQLSAELKFQTYMEETCFTFSGCLFRC